jgi:TIR domain
VDRLSRDLQDKRVDFWAFAVDMRTGAEIKDAIDEALEQKGKLLLVLSANSLTSNWVEYEVSNAFAKEHKLGREFLFPVRLDDAIFDTRKPWAQKPWVVKLRSRRNITDFRSWKAHESYQKSFALLLRDLNVHQGKKL